MYSDPKVVLGALKDARELIAKPKNWTQGVLAANANGDEVGIMDLAACQFCMLGAMSLAALERETYDLRLNLDMERKIHEVLFAQGTSCTIADFNDTRTHAEVLAVLDEAISKLEGEIE